MDFSDRIKPTHCSITSYLEDLKNLKYQIPTFQREVVWDKDSVKKLWDSLYRFYPVGSILIWKTDLKLQKHRAIGGHIIDEGQELSEHQYILDGQQRTTSLLTSVYGGKIEGRDGFDPALYFNLAVEASDEPEDESYKRRFLFWSEIDDGGQSPHANNANRRLYDEGLVVRLRDIAFNFGAVEEAVVEQGYAEYKAPERVRLREMKRVLDSYRMAFIELKGIRVAEVCQIFERINQAGKPLSIFDIVVAKTFEPAAQGGDGAPSVGGAPSVNAGGFYLRDLIDEFRASIGESAFAEVNDLTLLQAAATVVRDEVPGTKIKNVTDRYLNELTTDEIRTVWPGTADALKKTFDFLENHLHIKGPALVPYRYFYLALAAYFYENDDPDYAFLERFFWYVSFHNERLLRSTGMLWPQIELLRARKRGEDVDLGTFVVDRGQIRAASYSSRGRYSRAVLALFASHEPLDWKHPSRKVIVSVYYQLTDKPNLHHIFPLSFSQRFMKEAQWVDQNSLMNIAYLTQIANLEISARNPVEYLTTLDAFTKDAATTERVVESHLLPRELLAWAREGELPPDALRAFVEARTDLVLDDLRRKVGAERMQVVDTGAASDDED